MPRVSIVSVTITWCPNLMDTPTKLECSLFVFIFIFSRLVLARDLRYNHVISMAIICSKQIVCWLKFPKLHIYAERISKWPEANSRETQFSHYKYLVNDPVTRWISNTSELSDFKLCFSGKPPRLKQCVAVLRAPTSGQFDIRISALETLACTVFLLEALFPNILSIAFRNYNVFLSFARVSFFLE